MDNAVIPVLIIGAGPTGLLMACELARYSIPVKIIDKKNHLTITSNAAGIQTRTLEMFAAIGILNRFIEAGQPCHDLHFHYDGKQLFNLSFDVIDSLYKYILMLPQCDTESILEKTLQDYNYYVERNTELIGFEENGDFIAATIRLASGDMRTIRCRWLIGADGAHSKVREIANIAFPGEDLEEQFVVADAHLQHLPQPDAVDVFAGKGTVLAVFPLGETRYRLAANFKTPHGKIQTTPQAIRELVNHRAGKNIQVTDVNWISPFWIHSKMAGSMRRGRVFLAGDAAHIHSPVGGQGMNTGLQDVYNLAWKLAMVIKRQAQPSLLDSYEAERLPVIRDVVSASEKFTKVLTYPNTLFIALRNIMMRLMNTQQWLKRKITMRLTQLSIQYKHSPIIDYSGIISSASPKAGMRAPDILLQDNKRLHEYFDNRRHNILLFTGNSTSTTLKNHLIEIQKSITTKYSEVANVLIISSKLIFDKNNIADPDNAIHQRYGMDTTGVFIIRPDNYISYCSVINKDIPPEEVMRHFRI